MTNDQKKTADFNYSGWGKYGKSQDFAFLATDEDIMNVLRGSLPERYKPYSIIIIQIKKKGKFHQEMAKEYDIEEYSEIRKREPDITQFFIRSVKISRNLEIAREKMVSWHLTINGLINLYPQPISRKLGIRESHIGVVPIIVNKMTGETYEHIDYNEIFRSLRSGLRSILKFRVKAILDDGTTNQIPNLYMSERFANAADSGEIKTRFFAAGEKS